MTPKQSTGMAILAAAGMIMVILMLMSSCASKRKVIETEYIHDTVRVFKTDTVVKDRVTFKTDTIIKTNEKVVTLIEREEGRVDTVRIDTRSDTFRSVGIVDSISTLHVAVDSILKRLDQNRNKETVKVKSPPVKWIVIITLIIFAACVYFLVIRKN